MPGSLCSPQRQPEAMAFQRGVGGTRFDLVRSGENIPFGNVEEIRYFKIWEMKKYLEKCSRELFAPKSGPVVSFLLGTTGICDTSPST